MDIANDTTTDSIKPQHDLYNQEDTVTPVATHIKEHLAESKLERIYQSNPEIDTVKKRPTGLLWGLTVLSILSSTFLFSLDNTIVADVQPPIVRQFQATEKLPWLSVAFLLGATGTTLSWGQLYARFDAKHTYMLSVILFETGSAICGAAPNMNALIVGRAICGLGGAGMYTGVMVLLTVNTSETERPVYFGLCGLTWGTGTVLGPIIGGAFTDSHATWRWAFYINLCVGGLCSPVYSFLLPRADPLPKTAFQSRFQGLDILGVTLISGIFTAGLMTISFGGVQFDWQSGRTIGLIVTAATLLALFGIQQTRGILIREGNTIFPIRFLSSPTMVMMFLATACASTLIFVPVYFIPLYFQFVRKESALQAGIRLLPYVLSNVATAMVNGAVMSKKPYYMPWYLGCGILCTIGTSLFYTVDISTSASRIYGYSVLLGAGAGGIVQAAFPVVQATVEKSSVQVATGFCTFAQLAGPAVALSIANAVFLNEATDAIRKLSPNLARSDILAAISSRESDSVFGSNSDLQREALSRTVQAISKVYIIPLSAAVLTVLMSLVMKKERLF